MTKFAGIPWNFCAKLSPLIYIYNFYVRQSQKKRKPPAWQICARHIKREGEGIYIYTYKAI